MIQNQQGGFVGLVLRELVLRALQYRIKSLRFGHVFHVSPHQTCFYPHFQVTMPCQSLGEISANLNQKDKVRDRFELTSNWCSHIISCTCDDQSLKAITEDLQMLMSTICSTISHHEACYDNKSLHWCGHSNIVCDSLHCHLLHEVHINFKIQYRDLQLNLDLHEKTVSKFSLYHILKNEDITNWLVKKRSQLILKVTVKHLQFIKDHEHWSSNEWKIFLWSDKYSVKHDSNKKW